LPVIEKLLNHVSGSFAGIVGVYQRHSFADEKRAAMQAWARHVEQLVAAGQPRSCSMAKKLTKEQRAARAQKEAELTEGQRAARKQHVQKLLDAASLTPDPDRAAQLRAEARELAEDPEFWTMQNQAERYERIANTVTAKSEKQVRARRSPAWKVTKPWHKDADPILNELHEKNCSWKAGRLREALEEQWGSKPERPKLPEPRAIERHIEKLLNQGDPTGESK
jgi:hypothetical protein